MKELDAHVTVVDLNSTDGTFDICRKHTKDVWTTALNGDFSRTRNNIVADSKTDWQMFIEPWEVLTSGHEDITKAIFTSDNYRLMVLRGSDMIMKELRLWRKSSGVRFRRPAFESLEPEGKPKFLMNAVIYAEPHNDMALTTELITSWKSKHPTLAEPDYYLAMTYLMHGRYDQFLNVAEHFLFQIQEADQSVIMIKYYCAVVYCHVKKMMKKATKHIMQCIMVNPLMAEFWCLMGDILLHQREFVRSRSFYQNAIDLGCRRLQEDPMSLEIPKYDEYPTKMIKAIDGYIRP